MDPMRLGMRKTQSDFPYLEPLSLYVILEWAHKVTMVLIP